MANTKLPSLNKVIIVGNLVRDPELRYTSGGVPVVNFKIASNKRYKDIKIIWECVRRMSAMYRSGGLAGFGPEL